MVKFKKKDVTKWLSFLSSGADRSKSASPLANIMVLASNKDDSGIYLQVTSGNGTFRVDLEGEFKNSFSIYLPFDRFMTVLGNLQGEEVTVNQVKNQISIKSGKSNYFITRISKESNLTGYDFESIKGSTAIPLSVESLRDSFTRVMFAVPSLSEEVYTSSDLSLHGVLLDFNNTPSIFATDKLSFISYTIQDDEVESSIKELFIPRKTLGILKAMLGNAVASDTLKMGSTDNHLIFKCGDAIFSTNKTASSYVSREQRNQILTQPVKVSTRVGFESLKKSLSAISSFVGTPEVKVKMELSNNQLELSVATQDGNAVEVIDCDYKGDTLTYATDARKLQSFLSSLKSYSKDIVFDIHATCTSYSMVEGKVNTKAKFVLSHARF